MKPKHTEHEAIAIIRSLLEIVPMGHCAEFHHAKKDRHAVNEECPVVARYERVIGRAQRFIDER